MDKTKARNETLLGILILALIFLFILYLLFIGFFNTTTTPLSAYSCSSASDISTCTLIAYNNSQISFSATSTNKTISYNTQLACTNETTYSSVPSNAFRAVPQFGSAPGRLMTVTGLPCVGDTEIVGSSGTYVRVYLWLRYTAVNGSENDTTNPWVYRFIARFDFGV